jgi:phosphatidylserine/phosphatidylglycerophosphate/cardiolipin synthase-like enzyme
MAEAKFAGAWEGGDVASRSIVVLPDDSALPILEAIAAASRSLLVKMFVLSDPLLLRAVVAARRRGVKVRVMLDAGRGHGDEENRDARQQLTRAGVEVADGSPQFTVMHEKSLVADEELAFVQSFNWTKNLTSTRDYAVVTSHAREVRQIVDAFEADWHREPFHPVERSPLVWSPGSRDRICRFIDEAEHTLVVQNERFLDATVVERMVRAARRGVKVRVMTRSPHALRKEKLLDGLAHLRILAEVGVKVRELKDPRLHGKLLLADTVAAMVGSINLTRGSLDDRRDLAIEVRDRHVVNRLEVVAHGDWKRSRALDLSDGAFPTDVQDAAALERRVRAHSRGSVRLRVA